MQAKGTTIATATDFDGNFTLSGVNPEKAVLKCARLAYNPKRGGLKGRTSGIDIFMETNFDTMDEVVVIGLRHTEARQLYRLWHRVDAEAIERMPVANVGPRLLYWDVCPVCRLQQPTVRPTPRLPRACFGVYGGSLTQSNEPLVLIDGFEPPPDVPATDAEDIQVLKDAK